MLERDRVDVVLLDPVETAERRDSDRRYVPLAGVVVEPVADVAALVGIEDQDVGMRNLRDSVAGQSRLSG
ncbi:MAG: hypothetical protein R3E12_18135 [Candidatus Eisenbacteria bacterium]